MYVETLRAFVILWNSRQVVVYCDFFVRRREPTTHSCHRSECASYDRTLLTPETMRRETTSHIVRRCDLIAEAIGNNVRTTSLQPLVEGHRSQGDRSRGLHWQKRSKPIEEAGSNWGRVQSRKRFPLFCLDCFYAKVNAIQAGMFVLAAGCILVVILVSTHKKPTSRKWIRYCAILQKTEKPRNVIG